MSGALLVSGSRTIKNDEFVAHELDRLMAKHQIKPTTLLTGHAEGVDQSAERWAIARGGIELKYYIPDWNRYGRAAGPIRNGEMVNDAQWVIAFWNGESPGTSSAIDAAKAKGNLLETIIFNQA